MKELKALCMKCRDANRKPTMQTMTNPVVTKMIKGDIRLKVLALNVEVICLSFFLKADAESLK